MKDSSNAMIVTIPRTQVLALINHWVRLTVGGVEIPEDARITGVFAGWQHDGIDVRVEHESYLKTEAGMELPRLFPPATLTALEVPIREIVVEVAE